MWYHTRPVLTVIEGHGAGICEALASGQFRAHSASNPYKTTICTLLSAVLYKDRFLEVEALMLRSCGLNVRLVQMTEASTLKEMKESL